MNLTSRKKDTANAMHYNSKGHKLSDFKALVIERVIPNDGAWLLEREDFWIKKLETKTPNGLNRNDWKSKKVLRFEKSKYFPKKNAAKKSL